MILNLNLINTYKACPECGSAEFFHLEDYDPIWKDGEIYCLNYAEHKDNKKVYVRGYDAG